MAWCPFAVHRPLSENNYQGRITPRAVIMHTAVSSSPSLFSYFQNSSDLESHFYVADDGTIEQYMDTTVRADANLNANAFAVSIETQDGGKIVPWTSAQIESIVRLIDWLCSVHDIPRRQIPSAYSSGIGWHVQFGAPGPWTPVSKSCPGGPRIEQTKNIIIPRVAAGQINGGFLMSLSETEQRNLYNRVMGFNHQRWYVVKDGKASEVGPNVPGAVPAHALDTLDGNYLVERIKEVAGEVEALKSAQTAPVTPEIDYDRIIRGVVEALPSIHFVANTEE